jgi:hypothetical protein
MSVLAHLIDRLSPPFSFGTIRMEKLSGRSLWNQESKNYHFVLLVASLVMKIKCFFVKDVLLPATSHAWNLFWKNCLWGQGSALIVF